jgi:signal transduction histidine kinase
LSTPREKLDSWTAVRAERVRRRVRLLSGLFSLFTLMMCFVFDPMTFRQHPQARWLHLLFSVLLGAVWLYNSRPRTLSQVEWFTTVVWSIDLVMGNLLVRWIDPELVSQLVAGNVLSMLVLAPLSLMSWRACLALLAVCEVSVMAVIGWRFGGALPGYLWPMTPLILPTVGAVLLVARHQSIERAEFFAREELTEAKVSTALRAQYDAFLMELHDGVQGTLSRAAVLLDASSRPSGSEGEAAPQSTRLAAVSSAVREALEESASMLSVLEGAPEDWAQLVSEVRHLCASMCEGAGLELKFVADGSSTISLAPVVGHALRRVAREAMNNVVRHSGARSVRCELQLDGDAVHLSVRDDGDGLSAPKSEAGRGLGIMRRRAERLGGVCTIADHAEGGVAVEVTVPVGSRTFMR